VLLGHTLAYRLMLPDAHARADELARSGHAYLAGANAVGVVAAVAALAVLFLGRLLRSEAASTSAVLTHLLAFQIAAFTAMEVLERCASGAGLSKIAPVLLLGLPVQAAVAAVIALIARAVSSAAERFGRAAWAMESGPAAIVVAIRDAVVLVRRSVGSPPGRAPPSFLPT
jgi:hypothetical protein